MVVRHRIEARMLVGKCGRVVGDAKGDWGTFGTVWVFCVIRNFFFVIRNLTWSGRRASLRGQNACGEVWECVWGG